MKKLIFITILVASVTFLPPSVMAEKVAGESAKVSYLVAKNNTNNFILRKKMAIAKVLQNYNSPLSNSVDSFLSTCVDYEFDCYLLPSIAGLESSFGKFVLLGSSNPFGWANGLMMFDSWDQAIVTVGKGLRNNYINKGAESVDEIAPIYAASQTWAPRVKYFMSQFENEEEKIAAFLGAHEVQL